MSCCSEAGVSTSSDTCATIFSLSSSVKCNGRKGIGGLGNTFSTFTALPAARRAAAGPAASGGGAALGGGGGGDGAGTRDATDRGGCGGSSRVAPLLLVPPRAVSGGREVVADVAFVACGPWLDTDRRVLPLCIGVSSRERARDRADAAMPLQNTTNADQHQNAAVWHGAA